MNKEISPKKKTNIYIVIFKIEIKQYFTETWFQTNNTKRENFIAKIVLIQFYHLNSTWQIILKNTLTAVNCSFSSSISLPLILWLIEPPEKDLIPSNVEVILDIQHRMNQNHLNTWVIQIIQAIWVCYPTQR